jgi:hypothetical protein
LAIKGKGKTRSRRAVAAGPKPVYVVPRKPPLARRSVQFGALAVLLLVVGAILLWTYLDQRADQRLQDEQAIVSRFATRVETPLQPVSQQLPPTGLVIFGDLREDLTSMREETADPTQVAARAGRAAENAGGFAGAIEDIPTSQWVRERGLPIEMIDAQDFIVQAVRVFGRAADTIRLAAEARPGEQRDELLEVAEGLLDTGEQLFDRGYQKITNAKFELGIGEPQPFSPEFETPGA